mmetsp:Transcript_96458/g.268033  ORF Transcript_96458/g.268033 Transcript_96458/m.268033 type:complete len:233 (-) Transcript_96458:112-810(-)
MALPRQHVPWSTVHYRRSALRARRALLGVGLFAVCVAAGFAAASAWLPPPSSAPPSSRPEATAGEGAPSAAAARRDAIWPLVGLGVAAPLLGGQGTMAISGGGKDFSGLTLTQSFKGGDFRSKDFSGCVAQNVDFSNAKLQGNRFYKADLKGADFSGTDLTGSSLEQANLDGAVFNNANLESCYFTETIADAKSLKGAVFTDALLPPKVISILCDREDVQADAATRDSIPCP